MDVCRKVISTKPLINFATLSSSAEGIKYVEPDPCFFNYHAIPEIRIVDKAELQTKKYKNNTLVKVNDMTLIYPDEVWNFVTDMLSKRQVFALLYGPPGTGKTSIADVLTVLTGWTRIMIDTSILSKFVGQSEKNLRKKLKHAERMAPSIVLLDDGELFVSARSLASKTDNAVSSVSSNMVNILLHYMNEWQRKKIPIILIITTNMKISLLDPAILSRVAYRVNFPLPDVEAVEIFLQEKGITELKLRDPAGNIARFTPAEFARYAVNNGYGFRDIAQALSNSTLPRPVSTEGHRIVPLLVNEPQTLNDVLGKLPEFFDLGCPGRENILKLLFKSEFVKITQALLATMITEMCGSVVFSPSISSTPQEYLFAMEQYRNPVSFVFLPVANNGYYNIVDELINDNEKHIVILATPEANTDFVQSRVRVLDRDFPVKLLQRLLNQQKPQNQYQSYDMISATAKAFIKTIFNFYGIKANLQDVTFKGLPGNPSTKVFEEMIMFKGTVMPKGSLASVGNENDIKAWLVMLEEFLRSPKREL